MKLLVWNINQRSSGQKIPQLVREVIMDSNADIVVLTEFIGTINSENIRIIQRFLDGILSGKYVLRYNTERKECEGSNGVLIAVKKEFEEKDDVKRISETKIISKIEKMNTARTEQPNFLQVDMVVNGKLLSIIGTRIRVTDYEERREQVLSLIDHLNTLGNKNIIVAGDFNNARICGAEIADYSAVRENYRDKDTFDTYNYHIMKDDFANNGMEVFTPTGALCSWGFKLDRDGKPDNGYVKEDHIITTKNITIIEESLKYCHSFIKKYKNERAKKDAITPPFPDHAILTADVDLLT